MQRRLKEGSLALPLHAGPNPRMYEVLTANTPGCVAFSLPVQRRNLRSRRNLRLSRSLHSQRRARLTRRAVSSPSGVGPRLPSCSRDGFRHGITDYPDRRVRYAMAGERFGATPGFQRQIRRRCLPPTLLDGPTLDAPDCIANQDPGSIRGSAERQFRSSCPLPVIRFGEAPRVAFRPSPHPRIRWTVASPDSAANALGSTRPPPPRV